MVHPTFLTDSKTISLSPFKVVPANSKASALFFIASQTSSLSSFSSSLAKSNNLPSVLTLFKTYSLYGIIYSLIFVECLLIILSIIILKKKSLENK